MNEKEKLIELIQTAVDGCARNWAEVIANRLIENGAILPPVKIGTRGWAIYDDELAYAEVIGITVDHSYYLDLRMKSDKSYGAKYRRDIPAEWFYLSEEEAEKALVSREGKNEM